MDRKIHFEILVLLENHSRFFFLDVMDRLQISSERTWIHPQTGHIQAENFR